MKLILSVFFSFCTGVGVFSGSCNNANHVKLFAMWLLIIETVSLSSMFEKLVSNPKIPFVVVITYAPMNAIILSHLYSLIAHSKQWAQNCEWSHRRLRSLDDFKSSAVVFPISLAAVLFSMVVWLHRVNFGSFQRISSVLSVHLSSCQIMAIVHLFCIYLGILTAEIRLNSRCLSTVGETKLVVHFVYSQFEVIRHAREFVDLFGLQNLGLAFHCFFYLTLDFFYATKALQGPLLVTSGLICDILFRFHLIWLICHSAFQFNNAAEKFNLELFRLMRENKELCKNEKLQLFVTMRQTVNFTACGYFTIGYPLVTSIIAASTTYLVILIQFSTPSG